MAQAAAYPHPNAYSDPHADAFRARAVDESNSVCLVETEVI
jgi:hypothetical protein